MRRVAINTPSQYENSESRRTEKVITIKIMKISRSIWRIVGRIPGHLLIIATRVPVVAVEKTAWSRGVEGDFGARENDLDWCICRGGGEASMTAFKIVLSTPKIPSKIPFDATTLLFLHGYDRHSGHDCKKMSRDPANDSPNAKIHFFFLYCHLKRVCWYQ